MRQKFLAAAISIFVLHATGGVADAGTSEMEADVAACVAAPENRIGGAAIGECMEKRSVELDAEIKRLFDQAMAKQCRDSDRAALVEAQKAWTSLQAGECGLISRSPDNTVSYINGASCLVLQAHQRIEQLEFFNTYASPFCYHFALDEAASVRGEVPHGRPVDIAGTGVAWSLAGDPAYPVLTVTSKETGEEIASTPLECFFCSGDEDNCAADGIYVLKREDEVENPAMFAVCHKGAHSQKLMLIDPVRYKSGKVEFEVTGDYYLDWEVRDGHLQVRPDGDASRVQHWPGE